MQYITTTFLRTKLYKPRPAHSLLPRPALVKRIEDGLATDLTMVVAPVGFGKTTLVAAWAEQTAQPVAWLTLDENDNNPVDFVAYLLAAIHTLFPGACPETQGLLRSGRVPETAVLSSLLINEIDDLPQRFILVLDDYHDIHAPAIHKLLDSILRHPPLQMHLLIASRSEPPLALARLRANVRLNELRSKDLRFTQDETANFLAQAFGAEIDAHATDLLTRRAEGWIAGLQLAVLSLRTAQDQGTMLQNLERRVDRFIMNYLFEQVLQQQFPDVHAFLVKTSILDRISPDLALTLIDPGERPTGTLSLAELEHAGLFVNVLDDAGEWFSYHALFRELLRHHLQTRFRPEEVAALHRRASAWFRQNGLTDEALHHAIAAGDVDLAAQIITEQFPSWLVREEWRTLERWLEQMPPAAFEKHLWLLVAKTFVVQIQSQWELVVHLLERVEARLATPDSLTVTPESSVLRGYLDFLWSIHASININALQAKELAQRSMQCLPTEHMYVRGLAQTMLVIALQALGEIAVAEHMLTETLVFTPRVADGAYHRLRILMNLMSLRLADGRIEAAAQTARTLLQEALEFNAPSSQLWAHLALGVCAYQANDLALAAEHFAQGAELRHTGHIRGGHECLVSLALTFQMLGREDEVRSAVTRLADYDQQLTNAVLPYVRSLA